MPEGKNQQDLKQRNRALVLKLVCTERCLSRIDIARLTGLTKMTVSNIAAGLIEDGLIREGVPSGTQDGAGRKPIALLPREDSVRVVGVYIARDFVRVSLLTLSARIERSCAQPLSPGDTGESLLAKILDGFRRLTEGVDFRILGIGVASIGPLDLINGVILSPPEFHGIRNVEIRQFLEEQTHLPVVLNNGMQASALAEKLFGRGKAEQNFLYLGVTHGIGAGIVMDGKLLSGELGYSGEIGHCTIDYNGPLCSCGNRGCLEAYTSVPNVIRAAKRRMRDGEASVLSGLAEITFRDIAGKAGEDRLCGSLLEDMAFRIGIALANTVNTLDLSVVILGHEAAYGGSPFAQKIEDTVNERIFYKSSKRIRVEISSFRDEAPAVGSGVLILDRLFSGELWPEKS